MVIIHKSSLRATQPYALHVLPCQVTFLQPDQERPKKKDGEVFQNKQFPSDIARAALEQKGG